MHDTFERLGTSDVRIQVNIPWSELEAPYKDSLSKVRGSIQVRGFRPGKAPIGFVEKMVGQALVHEVAVEKIGSTVESILDREKIVPLRVPIDVAASLKVDADRNASWEAEIDVLPMIPKIEFEGLTFTPRRQVGDEDVSSRLQVMGARKAPLENAPQEHPIGQYDKVTLSGKATLSGEQDQVKDVHDLVVDLSPWGEAPPALTTQLQGKKAGDEGEIELILPLGEGKGDERLRLAHLSYKVAGIMTRRIPAIDEEFARDFDMESLEALRSEVREILEKESFDEHVASNGAAITDQLLDRVKFDLPRKMQAAIDAMAKENLAPATPEAGAGEGEAAVPGAQVDPEAGATGTGEPGGGSSAMARYYERFTRRNILGMLIANQFSLSLPERTMKLASERMRKMIDEQEGTTEQKNRAFDNWKGEFEQSLFNHMLNLFLVRQVDKTLLPEGNAAPVASPADGSGPGSGSQEDETE